MMIEKSDQSRFDALHTTRDHVRWLDLPLKGSVDFWPDGKRLRLRYRPALLSFVIVAAYVGWTAGWIIRDYIQFFTNTREAALWFESSQRQMLQWGIGLLLAYPILWLHYLLWLRRSLRASEAQWSEQRRSSAYWRNQRWPAVLLGWWLIGELNWFVGIGFGVFGVGNGTGIPNPLTWSALGGPAVTLLILATAIFVVNWRGIFFYYVPRLWKARRAPEERETVAVR